MPLKNIRIGEYWWNKKNTERYVVLDIVTNCTNEQNGQQMVEYVKDGDSKKCVREIEEFRQKFEKEAKMTRLERKLALIDELVKMLATRQAEFSVRLQASSTIGQPDPDVEQWRTLRSLTNMNGYPSDDEARDLLKEFLL